MISKFTELVGRLKVNCFHPPVYGLFRFMKSRKLYHVMFYPGTSFERGDNFSFYYVAPVSMFSSLQSFIDYVKSVYFYDHD